MREIVLPESTPALEWVNGRVLQKMSPRRKHGLAQARFAAALLTWSEATGYGDVGTEWEFRIQPPGEERRPLVPDVSVLAYSRVPYEEEAASDIPRVAPNIVVEIISPGDRTRDIQEKIRVYLAAGTEVIFLVDTDARVLTVFDAEGRTELAETDTLRHACMRGFSMPVRTLFERPRPKPPEKP